jgi:GAF domain-containing protein/DNA-binding NarL/FixJ family response regulator
MNILLVGGNAELQAESSNALQLALGDEVAIKPVPSFNAARRELQRGECHIVLDLRQSEETRWRLLRLARQLNPLIQVVMVVKRDQEDLITAALRQGANEVLVHSGIYPTLLPFTIERAYERYTLLEQRRQTSRQPFDLEALDEFTQAVTQAMDLGKALSQARTALHEIDILLDKSREELLKRRVMLREAGSEVQRRERGLKALSDLAEAVSSTMDLDAILANILDQALAMTTAETGAILIIEAESEPIRLAAQKRLSEGLAAALSGRWTDVTAVMTFLLSSKVLLVQDVTDSDAPLELLDLLSREGFTSMVGVPLQVGGHLMGGLVIATRHAEKLTERDARWLGVMGQQAGIAIENTRLRAQVWEAAENWFRQSAAPSSAPEMVQGSQVEMEQLTQALEEAKALLHRREAALSTIINVIGSTSYRPEVPVILQEALRHILEGSEAGGIWTLDESLKTLTLAAQTGLPENVARPWSQEEWEQDHFLNSLMSGESVYADDPASQTGSNMIEELTEAEAQVVVGIPLQIEDQSTGAMIIMAQEPEQLQAHDAELLTAVGQQLSQALERQKLHADVRRLAVEVMALQETQEAGQPPLGMLTALQQMAGQVKRREAQLASLRHVTQLLAQDTEQVLKAGLAGALSALDANAGLILLHTPGQDCLTLVCQDGLSGTFVDKWALQPVDIREDLPLDLLENVQTAIFTRDMADHPALIADLLLSDDANAVSVTPLSLQWQTDDLFGVLVLVFPPSGEDQEGELDQMAPALLPLEESDIHWLDVLAQTLTLSITSAGQRERTDEAKIRQPKPISLAEEPDQRTSELTVLLEFARSLFPILEINSLLEKATKEIAQATNMDACWVMMLENIREGEGEELVMQAHYGLSEDFARHLGRSTTNKGLHGQVMTSGQLTLVADLREEVERLSIAWDVESLRAFAGVPLETEEQRLGLLAVARNSVHHFSPSDQHLLTALGRQLSIALQNARCFAEIKRVASEQEKANRVLREINNLLMERLAELEKRLDSSTAAEPAT